MTDKLIDYFVSRAVANVVYLSFFFFYMFLELPVCF